jgi:hypothetical protein
MPCNASYAKLFLKDFYMHDKFDMQPICTSMLAKFYSCKKRVLQASSSLASSSSLETYLGEDEPLVFTLRLLSFAISVFSLIELWEEKLA